MKTLQWVLTAALLAALLPINAQPAAAQAEPPQAEPYTGDTLCQPDAFPEPAEDCLHLGPSAVLAELAEKGLTYPPMPLPVARPDPAMSEAPAKYARINLGDTEPAPIFSSLDDAVAGTNASRYLPAGNGLRYVVFIQQADVNGGHYVMLPSGEWMRASPAAVSSTYQGVVLSSTPRTSFGWIFDYVNAYSAPDYNAPPAARKLAKEELVSIYDKTEVNGTKWYMIGPNEWIDRSKMRELIVNTTPPDGVTNNRWIEVNLEEQTISVYDEGRLVFATMIATGSEPYYTRPGLFQIYEKKELETMQGAFEAGKADFYYLDGVPWTMYFDKARALHGAYWRAWFGMPQSHGCVNLSIGDSKWLFDWAEVGDWVYVHDPSGETPTDPAFYGDGGA